MSVSQHDAGGLFTHPKEFLKANLLCMRGSLPTVAGVHNFSFSNVTAELGYTCSRKSKYFWKSDHSINVWDIRHVARGGSAAFHLPYEPGQMKRAILPNEAMLMFTSEMTGCTFGMATYRDGTIEICHANYQTKNGHLDTARLSRETAWCAKRLEDHRYRETVRGRAVPNLARQARMGATVIGVRSPRGWTVYAQQWENLDGTNFKYLDLIEL
nr:hypothetical protein [uncultured Roseococcus sp.]